MASQRHLKTSGEKQCQGARRISCSEDTKCLLWFFDIVLIDFPVVNYPLWPFIRFTYTEYIQQHWGSLSNLVSLQHLQQSLKAMFYFSQKANKANKSQLLSHLAGGYNSPWNLTNRYPKWHHLGSPEILCSQEWFRGEWRPWKMRS